MIRLYRNRSKFKESAILTDNESFFNNNVTLMGLDEKSQNVMYDLDKAALLDEMLGTIKTPYGITNIDNLSTGCKTVLNYLFLASHRSDYANIQALDATECGWNALEELFRIIEATGYNIGVILEHDNKLYNCSDRQYCIDDEEMIESLFEF